MMDRSIIRIPVYVGFALACFLVALVLTFPDERLKDIATVQIQSQLGQDWDVEIEDLDLWWLSGVQLEGITLSERVDPAAETDEEVDDGDKPPVEPVEIFIPEVGARFAPISSLFNMAPTVLFNVDLGGGDIDGSFAQGSEARTLSLEIDSVDLKEVQFLKSFIGLPAFGTLDGEVELVLDPKRPLLTDGHIDLSGKQLTIGPATIQSEKFGAMTFIDVPQTNFGELTAQLEVDKPENSPTPVLEFKEVKFDGRDIRGAVWGDIKLAQTLAQSRSKLEMRVQFDKNFVQKNNLSSVLRMKWFREGKNKSWYGFVMWGPLGDPNFRGAPTAAGGPTEGGGTASPGPPEPLGGAPGRPAPPRPGGGPQAP